MAIKNKDRQSFKNRQSWHPMLIVSITVLVLISILVAYLQFFYPAGRQTTTATLLTTTTVPTTTTTIQLRAETGRLMIAVKDEQLPTGEFKLPGGTTILNISMRIGNITAHYVDNENENNSRWVVVSSEIKQLQLLDYTDIIAIIGEGVLEAGKYTQIRMYITEANITIKNAFFYIYTGKTYQMVIPSKELKTARQFYVNASKTTVLTFDFDVESSVTHTADGYLLRPVIKILEQSIGYDERPKDSKVVS